MGWLTEGVEAVHVAFGTVLGPDGRPFKTRAGGTVRLMHLIDEAVDSARRTVAEREPDLSPRPSWTASPSRPASARSSTPTCRPPASRTTRSTSRGWCR